MIAACLAGRIEAERRPDARAVVMYVESRWRDAEYGALAPLNFDLLADDFRIRAEAPAPQRVADHHDWCRVGEIGLRAPCGAELHLHAEHVEHVRGDERQRNALRPRARTDVEGAGLIRGDVLVGLRARLELEVFRWRYPELVELERRELR